MKNLQRLHSEIIRIVDESEKIAHNAVLLSEVDEDSQHHIQGLITRPFKLLRYNLGRDILAHLEEVKNEKKLCSANSMNTTASS